MGTRRLWLALAFAAGSGTAVADRNLFLDVRPYKLCADAGGWRGEFSLAESVTAQVEIKRVTGARREHKGEARFWIDGLLLGPIRREYDGAGWSHPKQLSLSSGVHRLEIECGEEAFEIQGVRVWMRGAGRTKAGRAARPPLRKPSDLAQGPCGMLKINKQWPGKPERAVLLSVTGGKKASTGLLATLKRGEALRWYFKIEPRPLEGSSAHPPILFKQLRSDGGQWQLEFELDGNEWAKAVAKRAEGLDFFPKGYKKGKWNPLDLTLCEDGRFLISLSEGEVQGEIEVKDPSMPLEIIAKDLEISVKGGL